MSTSLFKSKQFKSKKNLKNLSISSPLLTDPATINHETNSLGSSPIVSPMSNITYSFSATNLSKITQGNGSSRNLTPTSPYNFMNMVTL